MLLKVGTFLKYLLSSAVDVPRLNLMVLELLFLLVFDWLCTPKHPHIFVYLLASKIVDLTA